MRALGLKQTNLGLLLIIEGFIFTIPGTIIGYF